LIFTLSKKAKGGKMKLNLKFLLLACFLFIFVTNAHASLKGYTYPYDISQIEWQILNWTAAFRGSTTPGEPFTLERMEYDRSARKVMIYLKGSVEFASEDNLKKSVDGCALLFKQRFPDFDQVGDLYISYKLSSPDSQEVTYKEYQEGSFSDGQSAPTSTGAPYSGKM
jgi:hypothetical protein